MEFAIQAKSTGAKMNKFIFDVDGTLTPSRQKIDPTFREWFKEFCISNDVYLVTGSDYAKTAEQLGNDLLIYPVFVYNCSGNETWTKGKLVRSQTWDAPQKLHDLLEGWLSASKFPVRTGQHIEKRTGMINFSVVGRGATPSERKIYVEWDQTSRERETIAYQINSEFDSITATIGGETGIDIHPTGWDKSQILKDFGKEDKLYFFGDRCDPEGNDFPLAKRISNSYQVKDWRETWNCLLHLQEGKIAA